MPLMQRVDSVLADGRLSRWRLCAAADAIYRYSSEFNSGASATRIQSPPERHPLSAAIKERREDIPSGHFGRLLRESRA